MIPFLLLATMCPQPVDSDDTGIDGTDTDSDTTEVSPVLRSDAAVLRIGDQGGWSYREPLGWSLPASGAAVVATNSLDADGSWLGTVVLSGAPGSELGLILRPDEIVDALSSDTLTSFSGARDSTLTFRDTDGCLGLGEAHFGLPQRVWCPGDDIGVPSFSGITIAPSGGGVVPVRVSRGPSDSERWAVYNTAFDPQVARPPLTKHAWEFMQPPEADVFTRIDDLYDVLPAGPLGLYLHYTGATEQGRNGEAIANVVNGLTSEIAWWHDAPGPRESHVGAPIPADANRPFGAILRAMSVTESLMPAWVTTIPGATPQNDGVLEGTGIYTSDGQGGIVRLVDLFRPLPTRSGSSRVRFAGTSLDASMAYAVGHRDHVTLVAALDDETSGLWSGPPDQLTLQVGTGDPVPGPDGRPLDGLTFAAIGPPVVAPDGTVVYVAQITGNGATESNDLGVWSRTSSGIDRLLARLGDPVPGTEDPIRVIRLHDDLRIPSSLAAGRLPLSGVGGRNGTGDWRARGTLGTGSTIAGLDSDPCGQALVYVEGNVEGALMSYVLDPECTAGLVVNTTGDGSDVSVGDGVCDVGGALVDGERPCSLRAAIEEANARQGRDRITVDLPGQGPHVIGPEAELPIVMGSLFITTQDDVTVSGAGFSGDGLVLTPTDEGDDFDIDGLGFEDIDGHGIVAGAPLTLANVRVARSCGWGVLATANVTVTGASDIVDNGAVGSCSGGGLLIDSDAGIEQVLLQGVVIDGNGGPGLITTAARVDLRDATLTNNRGQGVAVLGTFDPPGETRLTSRDLLTVSGNTGHGVQVDGGVLLAGTTTVSVNGGWGIVAAGASSVGTATGLTDIHNNGVGLSCDAWTLPEPGAPERANMDCMGGGMLVQAERTEVSRLSGAQVLNNAGPGAVAVGHGLSLAGTTIDGNAGPGVWVPAGTSVPDIAVSVAGPTFIGNNHDDGILATSGDIVSNEPLELSGNRGRGAWTFSGDIVFIAGPFGDSPDTTVFGNGQSTSFCRLWSLSDDSGLGVSDAVCSTDGLGTAEGSVLLQDAHVQNNGGFGIVARGSGEDSGFISLEDGLLCGNGAGPTDATGSVVLTNVNASCPTR